MKKGYIIGGLAILAGITVIGMHLAKQIRLLKTTCFNFAGYKIHTLSKDGVKIEIVLNLRNRSDIAIVLKSYNFNVSINNTQVSVISSGVAQVIDRNSYAPISLMVDIDPKKLLDLRFISGVLLNVNNAMVKIQGRVSINAGGIPASMPVLIESKLRDMIPTGPSQPCL
jgi:LEA14-like dessication related protein